jgi:hypothetical protein
MTLNEDRSRAERILDPDVLPWEKQPGETDLAYAGFLRYRDMERRSVRDAGPNSNNLSVQWQWSVRCLEWDRFVQRQDDGAMVRYRVQMNERQRAAGRLGQQKVITWLVNLDPATLSPHEAARWFEVAVRAEREAAGAGLAAGVTPPPVVPDPFEGLTLGDIMGMNDRADEIDVAERLFAEIQDPDVRAFQPPQEGESG